VHVNVVQCIVNLERLFLRLYIHLERVFIRVYMYTLECGTVYCQLRKALLVNLERLFFKIVHIHSRMTIQSRI